MDQLVEKCAMRLHVVVPPCRPEPRPRSRILREAERRENAEGLAELLLTNLRETECHLGVFLTQGHARHEQPKRCRDGFLVTLTQLCQRQNLRRSSRVHALPAV